MASESISKPKNALKAKEKVGNIFNKFGIYFIFVLIVLILSMLNEHFMTASNIRNILLQVTINGIMAVGVTMVIITGGIDLSLGSILAFAGVISTTFAHNGISSPLTAIVMGLLAGTALGVLNGLAVAYLKITPFIVTLGMTTIARGMPLSYTQGRPIIGLDGKYTFLGQGEFLNIPIPIIFFVIILVVGYLILQKTRLGRYIYATGGNENAAEISGIDVAKVKLFVYSFTGLACGLSGILLAARTNAGAPNAGTGYELDAIAASVIGGASLSGGRGTISGTLIGVLIIGIIQNGLDILNVSSYIQLIVKGIIIVGAVWLDKANRK